MNPADVISLTEYAAGKIDTLEPFSGKVEKKFNDWINKNGTDGRKFTEEELEWLPMLSKTILNFKININIFSIWTDLASI